MATPVLGLPELVSGQALPETTVNEQTRILEQGARWFVFLDRDLATPPGSPADGDAYLVAASATGAWSGHDGEIAWRMSTACEFITPSEGMGAYVADENKAFTFNGSTWDELATAAASVTSVTTQSGTSYTLDADDANSVILFTNASGCDVTVPDGVFSVGDFIELHQQTTGTVAVLDNGTSTVNARDDMIFLSGQYSVAGLRCTATDVFNLTGDLEAGS